MESTGPQSVICHEEDDSVVAMNRLLGSPEKVHRVLVHIFRMPGFTVHIIVVFEPHFVIFTGACID